MMTCVLAFGQSQGRGCRTAADDRRGRPIFCAMEESSTTPSWFISGPSLASVGEKRAAAQKETAQQTLHQIFPAATDAQLQAALAAGGDLTTIVDRLLAEQFAESVSVEAAHSSNETAGMSSTMASGSSAGGGSSSEGGRGGGDGPKRRVRFSRTLGLEQMEREAGAGPSSSAAHGEMSRLSDEELCEQMASSGITAEPTAGSARGAARGGVDGTNGEAAALGELLQAGGLEPLRTQPLAELATGALRLSARIIKTSNELEAGLLSEKIVTKFVIECQQLAFRWEVPRRYSEFHHFHELLSLQWDDLPPLPPKLLFSQEVDDVAQRMMEARVANAAHACPTPRAVHCDLH